MSTSSSKKRTAAQKDEKTPTKKTTGAGHAKKDKKEVVAAAEIKEVKEDDVVEANEVSNVESKNESAAGVDEAHEASKPAKKKRKVVRFNAHNPRDYLNLPRYWKHHETLRNNLLKAEKDENGAVEQGDKEAAEAAAISGARYTGILERLESRRADVTRQLEVAAALIPYSNVAGPLLSMLMDPFTTAVPDQDAADAHVDAPADALADA